MNDSDSQSNNQTDAAGSPFAF